MSFLNPLYLVAALAALVPLIIHLLHRQRIRIEVFPSLDFLRRMLRRRTRRFHLKQILLLLARILILLFLALALARPTIMGGATAKGHLPTAAVIILDDSYSMLRRADGQTLFDVAKAKVKDLLDYFNRSDEVHIITGSSPPSDISEGGRMGLDQLRERISRTACSNHITDLATPLGRAVSILRDAAMPNNEIYIVSDMQRLGWAALEETLGVQGLNARVVVVDLGEPDPNACVKDIGFKIPAGSDDLEMEVTFERFNSGDAQGRVAEVFLKGALLDRAVFSRGDLSRETETFRLPALPGFYWGEVAIAPDRLETDDTRYFAVTSRRRTVGIVGDTYYIRTALSPEGGGGFEPVEIEEGGINAENLARLDVLITAGVARFSPIEVEAISDFLATGGSLLIFLGNRVDVGAYNHNLLPRLGDLRIDGPAGGDRTGFYTIDRLDASHPVFAKFKPDENPFAEAKFYTFMKVAAGNERVLASFSDGSPALVESGGRVMVFTSSADGAWNDFVMTSQFLPLLHEMLLHMSTRSGLSRSYGVGDEITVKAAGVEGDLVLNAPNGAVRRFPAAVNQAGVYSIESPEEPGIYFLKSGPETLSVFAVNVDTAESDLTKISVDDLKAMLRGFDVRGVASLDDLGETVALLRTGRDISRVFLWGALILVIFEALLASNLGQGFRSDRDEDTLTHS